MEMADHKDGATGAPQSGRNISAAAAGARDTRLAAAGSQMVLSLARSGRQAQVTELPPPGSPEQVSKVEEVALAVAAS
jgi:hypothetical protein